MSAGRASALERIHAWAAVMWLALIGGGGLGFVVRDLLDAGRPLVALAWVAGAALLAAPALARRRGTARGRPGYRGEQATTAGSSRGARPGDDRMGRARPRLRARARGAWRVRAVRRRALLRRFAGASHGLRRARGLRRRRPCPRPGVRRARRGARAGARAEPRLRARRAPAPGGLAPLPRAPLCDRTRRARSRRPPRRRRRRGDRVHAPPAARRADLHPVLALLPGLEHNLRRRRPGLGGELAAAEGPRARQRQRRLAGLPPGRLGVGAGAARPGRQRVGARELARPLPGLQARRLPQPLGSPRPAGRECRTGATPVTSRRHSTRASGRRPPRGCA